MSRIKGKNTKPELIVRKFLFSRGFRYRLHDKRLPGKPDIILPKHKTIIFVHGCFWHGHSGCKYHSVPKTNTNWWIEKLNKNKANDEKIIEMLSADGWKVIVIWECNLKNDKRDDTLNLIVNKLRTSV